MITVKSYPNLNIELELTEVPTNNSTDKIQNLWIDISEAGNDEYIEVVRDGQTITLLITDECRYTPMDVFFIGKEGVMRSMSFFKAMTQSMSVKSEQYKANRGQPNQGNHQDITFNVNASEKFKINSGFVDEAMNPIFKELLLSERVWAYADGTFTPIKVDTTSFEYKTRQKDRLINYEVEFSYAFDTINTI